MKRKVYTIKGLLLSKDTNEDKYGKAIFIQCHVVARFKFTAKRKGRKILEEKYKEAIKQGSIVIINKPPIPRVNLPKGVHFYEG